MTNVIDTKEILKELTVFIRNEDIMTITQRGVNTVSAVGTWGFETSSFLIDRPNVKNIRVINVAGNPLTRYTDYNVNYNYDDSGTIKCRITFTTPQTGAYVITHDFGTDKIFPDYPKTEMRISNFPRIALDVLSISSDAAGLGNENISEVIFTITIYSKDKEDIMEYIKTTRTKLIENQLNFYYLGTYVRPLLIGPIIISEDTKDKIFQQNIDFIAPVNYEIN